ncbi:MAG: GntR family transcriptional regulator [Candidatus Acidiferrales bacterium]
MTTSERLYRSLKQDITTCVLLPGTPFSEAELCRRYHTSRTPVREACRHLEREGLIKIVPFRGYFVAPLTLAQFHNLHEVQLIVDPAAAGLAALRATPAQLRSMEACAKYQYRVGVKTSYYAFLQRNFNLHVGIAQASQNVDLVSMVTSVQMHLMRFFYLIIAMDAFGTELVQEHEKIVAAIRARDPIQAQQCSAEHIRKTIRRSAGLFMTSTEARLGELIADSELLESFKEGNPEPWDAIPNAAPIRANRKLLKETDSALFRAARASITVDPDTTGRKRLQ